MTIAKTSKTTVKKAAATRLQGAASRPLTRGLLKTARTKSGKPLPDKKMFTRLYREEALSGIDAIQRIRAGMPVQILKSAGYFFEVPDKRIYNVMRIPVTTATRLEKNNAKMDAAATERMYRIAAITKMAVDLFEVEAAAADWIRRPNPVFDDVAPLELLDTEPGANAVKQVLNAIATGGAV